MNFRDFAILALICLSWGLNVVISRWVVADVPPFFYAFARFALLALVLAPWLRPAPKQLGLVALVAVCIGAGNFGFLFLALKYANASSVAVAGQLALPFTTLLSMAFLGERIGWRRGLGMALAFAGVVLLAYDPASFRLELGVGLSVIAALVGSIGGVAMKRMEPIGMFQLQAWVALVSFPILGVLTLGLEHDQVHSAAQMGWPFAAALLFSVLAVSMFGHGMYYVLVKRHDVTLLAPLSLMTPIWSVVFGVTLLHEPLTAKLLAGAALALTGVGMIAVRPNARLGDAIAFWRRWET